ncbi:MAG TPA: hypothetical protein VGL06_25770 [Pseudonocardiaceae bacterium]
MRVDDQKLTGLFQSAVRDAPPASFDVRDVAMAARAAKRATMRRRTWIIGGTGFVVVFLGVGLVLGGGTLGDALRGTSSASANSAAGQSTVGNNLLPRASGGQAQRVPNGTGFPTATPLQGGGGVGGVGPGADGTPGGCGPTDGQLAVALANELSSVGAPPKPVPASIGCPAGSRAAAYLVNDGSDSGYVVAVVTPAGKPTAGDGAIGVARAVAPASGGRKITVLSVPASAGATAPLTGGLFGIAQDLAGKV